LALAFLALAPLEVLVVLDLGVECVGSAVDNLLDGLLALGLELGPVDAGSLVVVLLALALRPAEGVVAQAYTVELVALVLAAVAAGALLAGGVGLLLLDELILADGLRDDLFDLFVPLHHVRQLFFLLLHVRLLGPGLAA